MKRSKGLIILMLLVICSYSAIATIYDLSGIVAYYSFEAGGQDDNSTLDGTFGGNSHSSTGGKVGNMSTYDGTSDSFTMPDDAAFTFGSGDFTISFWFYSNGDTSSRMFLTNRMSGSTDVWAIQVFDTQNIMEVHDLASDYFVTGSAFTSNTWNHLVWTRTGSNMTMYINAVIVRTQTDTHAFTQTHPPRFGVKYNAGGAADLNGNIDEVAFYKGRGLTSAEVTQLYNYQNTGGTYPFSEAAPTNGLLTVTLNGSDNYYSKTWTNNLTYTPVFNTSSVFGCHLYVNTSGSLVYNRSNTSALTNNTLTAFYYPVYGDITYKYKVLCNNTDGGLGESSVYTLTADVTNPLLTTNLEGNTSTFTGYLRYQVNTNDTNAKNITFRDSCNYSYTNISIPSPLIINYSFYAFNCSLGQKSVNFSVCDKAGNCISNNYLFYNRARLNITAINGITSAAIVNFTIYKNETLIGSTTTGTYSLDDLSPSDYSIKIDSLGYQLKWANVTINNTNSSYAFSLLGSNSLYITIAKEDTGEAILQNISIKFTSVYGEWTNITNTSYFYIENLSSTEYSIGFSSTGYSSRSYSVTIGNRTSQNLQVYLAQNTSETLFTITDKDSSQLLADVLVTMYRTINGSWSAVESKYSDITGRIQFTYSSGINYKFYLAKSNYNDYVFYLNPILFSSYDITMEKTTTINYTVDYDKLSLIYAPTTFKDDTATTFNFIISSPFGILTGYGINLTYPGGSSQAAGSNAIGSQLSVILNISGAAISDTVRLDYYYITTISGRRNFTQLFSIEIDTANTNTSYTFIDNKSNTFGLGIFERVLIATLMILGVVGISALIGQLIPGVALGLFCYGYVIYIGFIPIWIAVPSMVALVFLLITVGRGGGY